VDARATPHAEYESFIIDDLHAAVASRFRIDTLREAVAGVSMGGYGAAVLALKHPQRFRFAGLILPALSIPDSIMPGDTTQDEGFGHSIEVAFGNPGDAYRRQHDPFQLLSTASVAALPLFRVVVTPTDEYPSFVPMARRWVEAARKRGVRVEYAEVAGPHNMLTADAALPAMLESCWRALRARPVSPGRGMQRTR
jgi:S-formylglutathione hydrolase FrmB